MNSRSFFKLIIYMINWIKLSAFSLPVTAALVAMKQGKMKYGYDFLTVDHNWSIIIAIGFGMVLNTWHAISFEEVGNIDPKQYLKMRQKFVIIDSKWSLEQLKDKVRPMIESNKRWKLATHDPRHIKIQIKNGWGFTDILTLTPTPNGVEIYSRPQNKFAIVDMGRNLKNVKEVSKYLKESV